MALIPGDAVEVYAVGHGWVRGVVATSETTEDKCYLDVTLDGGRETCLTLPDDGSRLRRSAFLIQISQTSDRLSAARLGSPARRHRSRTRSVTAGRVCTGCCHIRCVGWCIPVGRKGAHHPPRPETRLSGQPATRAAPRRARGPRWPVLRWVGGRNTPLHTCLWCWVCGRENDFRSF